MALIRRLRLVSAIFIILIAIPTTSKAIFQQETDWPMFRGQAGTGVANGFVVPTHWNADPAEGELKGVLWQTKVPGLGHSSPIVVGNRIFLATAIASDGKSPLKIKAGGGPAAAADNGEQSWVVLCYDKETGKELWRRIAKVGTPRATRHAKATHANTSLTVVGDNVVAFFGSEGLFCFDLLGELKWNKDFGVINISKYGIGWGYASSPAVANDRIVVVCDDPKNPFVAALKLADGEEVWRVSRKDVCVRSWGTPLIHRNENRSQVVVNGYPWIVSYDLETGKEFWRLKGGGDNPVPTPFVANDWIYITNAHGGAAPIFVVRPDANGDITPAIGESSNDAVVWSSGKGGCYLSTPVVYDDHLYLGNSNGVVRCFTAKTGERVYQERLGANSGIVASLVAADGKVFCTSENGTVYVLAAGPDFKVLARNKMGAPCLATPAISQGVVYIRTTEKLVAIAKNIPLTEAQSKRESFSSANPPPNIVYIMSDELAYYEMSHMGNEKLHTPNIDQLARDGIRFSQALAAAPVCGPLRAAMMTGKHMGHCSVRTNGGGTPIRADEPTIASILKDAGYATGGFGKWGAGGRGSTGVPEKHGFDVFYGYYDQVHAHSFYPPYLIRNSEEVKLEGNDGGREGKSYSHYSIMKKALQFIKDNKNKRFFCYLPITPPHGMYDIPADDPAWKLYENDAWMKDAAVSRDARNYAAMVSMIDRDLKQVLDLLKELSLEENTIVFFTGDNGGQDRFKSEQHPRGFFGPNVNPKTGVEFRGGKSSLYEGGLRIPFFVRWPGVIKPGQVSNLLFNQVDMMKTLAELTNAAVPEETDGLSILPSLLGEEAVGRKQEQHPFLYWEYGKQTAVRMQQWKAIRLKSDATWQLYNLKNDISEQHNVADQHKEILAQMKKFAVQSHKPAQPGTFDDPALHRRDQQAKWGSKGRPPKKRP